MKNIIITTNFFPIEGGIQTYMLHLAKNWKHGKTLVYCKVERDEPTISETPCHIERVKEKITPFPIALIRVIGLLSKKIYKLKCIEFILILCLNRDFTSRSFKRINHLIQSLHSMKEHNIVMHASTAISNGAIGMFGKILFNVPLVTYIHGSEINRFKKKVTNRLLLKYVLTSSDLIISNSTYTKELIHCFKIPESKIKVVNLGAELDKFYPALPSIDLYKKHGISKNSKILLTISHLVDRKGHDMVIKTMALLIKTYPELVYLIVGRGPSENKLRLLIRDNNLEKNVILAGFVADHHLNDYMNSCDVFVMPNRDVDGDVEGYGIVFIEANACKKPVIAGDSGGAVDAVLDGETGLLVNPESEESIASAIEKLITNDKLRNEMGEFGYKRAIEELNWKSVTSKIYSYIDEVCI